MPFPRDVPHGRISTPSARWAVPSSALRTDRPSVAPGDEPGHPGRRRGQLLGRTDLPAGPGLRRSRRPRPGCPPTPKGRRSHPDHRRTRLARPGRSTDVGRAEVPHRNGCRSAASDWALRWSSVLRSDVAPVRIGSPATQGRTAAGYGGLFWRAPHATRRWQTFTAIADGESAVHGSNAPWLALSGALRTAPSAPWCSSRRPTRTRRGDGSCGSGGVPGSLRRPRLRS